ncbi:jupiter microtubule associated homolog 1-like [Palaemon carinicauda]|uniref:jupiter microtubule associated homolog 1-like n=1 Tax=Palaemon carinicauda TaxID=392227 RepID=UPI0035B65482
MTTTSTFVGIGDNQRISSRVLKPPGGGSSISFGDDGDSHDIKRKSTPVRDDLEQKSLSPISESNGESSSKTSAENDSNSLKESPSSSSTNYSKLDTQGRLFGEESQDNSNRKVRDRLRSRIFSDADENSTTKPDTPIRNENKGDKIHKQKQRVPPGGVSSKLW